MPTRSPREVTYICEWCSEERTELRPPGPQPRYCSTVCRHEAQNALAKGRMRRLRERQAAQVPWWTKRPRGRPKGH